MSSRCPRAFLGLVGIVVCSACGPMEIAAPTLTGQPAAVCRDLVGGLPDEVAGQAAEEVETGGWAAAWGDPAVVLRCGVPRPPAMTRSAECFVVDEVGWLAEGEPAEEMRFTTVGREVFVEVSVPAEYAPQADVLVDVGEAIRVANPVVQPCV